MLRAVLVGLLAVSAISSCGGGSDTEKVAPGGVAGKVLEASGNVAATRDGAVRNLAVGAEVFADDVIDTANGSVLILLHHNNARWSVESGQKARVDQSLAWKLAKQAGSGKAVDHASSAAGREGERTAADTRATSETAGAPPAVGAVEAAQAPGVPQPNASPPPGAKQDPGPPADSKNGAGDKGEGGAPKGTGGGPRTRGQNDLAQTKDVKPDAGGATFTPEVLLAAELEKRKADLRKCTGGNLALTLTVKVASGVPAIELAGGKASAKVRACLERVVKQIPTKGMTATASIELR